jgi:hypothetical protein
MQYSDEEIARVIHEANAVLQRVQGDPAPSLPWDSESDELRSITISGVRLARDGVTAASLHEAWMKGKRDHGWTYGPVKDAGKKTHPCLVAYGELPDHQKDKDRLFMAIVDSLTGDRID